MGFFFCVDKGFARKCISEAVGCEGEGVGSEGIYGNLLNVVNG